MPKIRQYTANITPSGATNVRNASAADFGGLEADALMDLGQSAQKMEDKLREVQERREQSEYERIMAEHKLELAKQGQSLSETDFGAGADIGQIYGDAYTNMSAELAKRIPPSQRRRFEVDSARLATEFQISGMRDGVQREATRAATNYEETLQFGVNALALDPSAEVYGEMLASSWGQIDALPGKNGAEKEALRKAAEDRLLDAMTSSRIDKNPVQFLADAEAGLYSDVPNLDRKIAAARAGIAAIEARSAKENARQIAVFESEVELALERAEDPADLFAVAEEIKANAGLFAGSPEKRNDLLIKLEKARKRLIKDNEDLILGGEIVGGTTVFNPADAKHRGAVNTYYEKILEPMFQDIPVEQRVAAQIDLVNRTKHLPARMVGEVQMAARSRDPEEVQAAVELVDRLRYDNPHLLSAIPPRDLARIEAVRGYLEAGYTKKEAFDNADAVLTPVGEQVRADRKKALANEKVDYRVRTKEIFNGWFDFGLDDKDPQSRLMISAAARDYQRALETNYLITEDLGAAKKHAEGMVRGLYSVTTVNGTRQIMKHPPEKYYGINGVDSSWIREQMVDVAKEKLKGDLSGKKIDYQKDLILAPHPVYTPRGAAANRPAYTILLRTDRGFVPVLAPNELWYPDTEAKRKDLIDDARLKAIDESTPSDFTRMLNGIFGE